MVYRGGGRGKLKSNYIRYSLIFIVCLLEFFVEEYTLFMDDAVVKPINEIVRNEIRPIRDEVRGITEQVAKNTVLLDDHSEILEEHSNKLDALQSDVIELRQTTEATYELTQLIAEKLKIKLPEKTI